MAAYRQGWLRKSPAGWLPVHRDQLWAQRLVTSMGELFTSVTNWGGLLWCLIGWWSVCRHVDIVSSWRVDYFSWKGLTLHSTKNLNVRNCKLNNLLMRWVSVSASSSSLVSHCRGILPLTSHTLLVPVIPLLTIYFLLVPVIPSPHKSFPSCASHSFSHHLFPSRASHSFPHQSFLLVPVIPSLTSHSLLAPVIQCEMELRDVLWQLKNANSLLDECQQPYQYLIESIRRRDDEISRLRQTLQKLDEDLRLSHWLCLCAWPRACVFVCLFVVEILVIYEIQMKTVEMIPSNLKNFFIQWVGNPHSFSSHFLSLSLPLPFFPLEVGPLNPSVWSGERCMLLQRALGKSPNRNQIWCT